MEKRALLAVVLSLLVFFLYQYFFDQSRKPPVDNGTPTKSASQQSKDEQIESYEKAVPLPEEGDTRRLVEVRQAPETTEKEISVTTDLYTAVFITRGAMLKSWKLKKFKDKIGEDAQAIELITEGKTEDLPLGLILSNSNVHSFQNAVFKVDKDSLTLMERGEEGSVSFSWISPEGIEINKKFIFKNDKYVMGLDVSVRNLSERDVKDHLVLSWKNKPDLSKDVDRFSFSGPVTLANGELEEIKVKKLDEDKTFSGTIQWAGYEDKYFISCVIPMDPQKVQLKISKSLSDVVSVDIMKPIELYRGQRETYSYSIYSGPKDYYILKSVGSDLKKALNLGWFDVIAKPMLIFLKYIDRFTHNYGIAIIVLTIVIKIIFFPLTHRSYKSMKDMQKVQPLMLNLKKKYKDDKQRLNKEIMALYRTHKVNPLGGCLPILIQIPVFFALYRALLGSIELRHAPFIFWINDLSAKDPYYITPILMGASMFIQQKMTPTVGDPTQAKMMLIMPIVFTFMFLNFPSGLVIYWLVNNVLSIGQQFYINKYTA
ncbi:MAG: membrane protein insertase YidC [Thermodesulfobacteriota bacterium]|nr:membrane protein insertase YidC [Thermodesulfobacteriota bacterium]